MITVNPSAYSINVRFGIFDGVPLFEARVPELAGVVEYAETEKEAWELAAGTIQAAAIAYFNQGREFPAAWQITNTCSINTPLYLSLL